MGAFNKLDKFNELMDDFDKLDELMTSFSFMG